MTETVYYAAMSLDGYIAEPEEKLTWLTGYDGPGYSGEGESANPLDFYPAFMAGIGSLVMGSKTYEFVLGEDVWTYGELPAWVYTSRELPHAEGAPGLRFASGDVRDRHDEIAAAAHGKDVWLIGGGDLASQYLEAGLLDRVQLTVVPTVLGDGLPLFAGPVEPMELLGVTPFGNGMCELSYRVHGDV